MALTIKNKEIINRLMEGDYPGSYDRERVNKMVWDYNTDSIYLYRDLDFVRSFSLLRKRERKLEELLLEASFNDGPK